MSVTDRQIFPLTYSTFSHFIADEALHGETYAKIVQDFSVCVSLCTHVCFFQHTYLHAFMCLSVSLLFCSVCVYTHVVFDINHH